MTQLIKLIFVETKQEHKIKNLVGKFNWKRK